MSKNTTYAERVARIAAALVALAGFAVLAIRVADADQTEPHAAVVLALTWCAVLFAHEVSRRWTSSRELRSDRELLVASSLLPGIAAVALVPISLHLPFSVLITSDVRGFDVWATALLLRAPWLFVVATGFVLVRMLRRSRGIRTSRVAGMTRWLAGLGGLIAIALAGYVVGRPGLAAMPWLFLVATAWLAIAVAVIAPTVALLVTVIDALTPRPSGLAQARALAGAREQRS